MNTRLSFCLVDAVAFWESKVVWNVFHVLAVLLGLCCCCCCCCLLLVRRSPPPSSTRTKPQQNLQQGKVGVVEAQAKNKKRQICKCPFSKESSFVADKAPKEEEDDGDDDENLSSCRSFPGLRWLAAGLSGQDQPGHLRAQLHRFGNNNNNNNHSNLLPPQQSFLWRDDDPNVWATELALKTRAYNDPWRHPHVFVMQADSRDAQQETLELFLAYLPQQYPDIYEYDKEKDSITVHLPQTSINTAQNHSNKTEMTYFLKDWKQRPLELCARIVQEDLVLMRKEATDMAYFMAAAAVVFSFDQLPQRLGQSTNFIHAPVPGFQQHLSKVLYHAFKNIVVEKPLWRNNWTICASDRIDNPSDSDGAQQQQLPNVRDRFLKIEYQTIRRLPRHTDYLLFTVHTFLHPVSALEHVPPRAAQTLAASMRGMAQLSTETLEYRGLESRETLQVMLDYLDSIGGARDKQQQQQQQESKGTEPT